MFRAEGDLSTLPEPAATAANSALLIPAQSGLQVGTPHMSVAAACRRARLHPTGRYHSAAAYNVLLYTAQEFASADEADIAGDTEVAVQLPSQQRAAASLPTDAAGIQLQRASVADAAGFVRQTVLPSRDSNALFQGRNTQLGSLEGAVDTGHVGSTSRVQRGAPATQQVHIVTAADPNSAPSALFSSAVIAGNSITAAEQGAAGAREADGIRAAERTGVNTRARSSTHGGGIMQQLAAAPDAVRGALFGRSGSGGGDGARGSGFAAVTSVESSGQQGL